MPWRRFDGSSAHISWNGNELRFFGGCAKHETFAALFNKEELVEKFKAMAEKLTMPIIIYGESYGGKIQKMAETYGPDLRFVAFEVKHGEIWLDVPSAADTVKEIGLEFVDWERGPATIEWVNSKRDQDSTQAIRNGMGPGKIREGVMLRPIVEQMYRGHRVIAKHKRKEFSEHKNHKEISPEKFQAYANAKEVADDWVTLNRLEGHVLPKLNPPATELKDTPRVIAAMREDIKKESVGEIEWSDAVDRAIGTNTAKLFKSLMTQIKVNVTSEANK